MCPVHHLTHEGKLVPSRLIRAHDVPGLLYSNLKSSICFWVHLNLIRIQSNIPFYCRLVAFHSDPYSPFFKLYTHNGFDSLRTLTRSILSDSSSFLTKDSTVFLWHPISSEIWRADMMLFFFKRSIT